MLLTAGLRSTIHHRLRMGHRRHAQRRPPGHAATITTAACGILSANFVYILPETRLSCMGSLSYWEPGKMPRNSEFSPAVGGCPTPWRLSHQSTFQLVAVITDPLMSLKDAKITSNYPFLSSARHRKVPLAADTSAAAGRCWQHRLQRAAPASGRVTRRQRTLSVVRVFLGAPFGCEDKPAASRRRGLCRPRWHRPFWAVRHKRLAVVIIRLLEADAAYMVCQPQRMAIQH